MGDRQPPSISSGSRVGITVHKPRWGFWKGLLTGVAIEVPVLTGLVWLLARLGIGDAAVPFMRILRLTTVFAGVAALFTAGGIGRLSAYASIDGGRRRAMIVAARAHAAASTGLLVIAAIPHGSLPAHPAGWLAYVAGGMIGGAACGALIGLVAGGTAPVELADVWQLARRPGEALKSWLDPSELVRLGAAMRHRTTNLFEGMFDPQAPAPTENAGDAKAGEAPRDAPPDAAPAPPSRTKDAP